MEGTNLGGNEMFVAEGSLGLKGGAWRKRKSKRKGSAGSRRKYCRTPDFPIRP